MKPRKPSFSDDREITAYHEAGHVVAARLLGLEATANIWWDGTEPTIQSKCVLGQTDYYSQTSHRNRAVIGWAGLVGEQVAKNRLDGVPDDDLNSVWEEVMQWGQDFLSATDAAHLGEGNPSRQAFEQAVEIINRNRHLLEQEARRLVRSLPRKSAA